MPEETAVVNINPGVNTDVMRLHEEILKALHYARERIITKPDEVDMATKDLSLIKKLTKTVQEKRTDYVKPLNDHVAEINATFKLLTEPLIEADKITRRKILDYNAEVNRKIQEAAKIEQEKLDLARREEELIGEHTVDLSPVEAPAPARQTVRTDLGTASIRKNWKWEVIDFSLVPDEYKVIDNSQLSTIARKHHDAKVIPGVRFYSEEGLQMTAK